MKTLRPYKKYIKKYKPYSILLLVSSGTPLLDTEMLQAKINNLEKVLKTI